MPPIEGVVKLIVHGALDINLGRDGVGGLIGDAAGIWLGGFAESLGETSNIAVEL